MSNELEDLGLLFLLERIGQGGGAGIDGFVRYGLVQRGMVTAGPDLRLTELGERRLVELRRTVKVRSDGAPRPA